LSKEPTESFPKFNNCTDKRFEDSIVIKRLTNEKIFDLLTKLNQHKAMGCDRIHPQVLKNAAAGFVTPLRPIFTISYQYLTDNKLINPNQHGFVEKRCCTTNLLETLDYITYQMAKGKPICVVYLDFAKAFDKVISP
jgi:hypothetical protein